MKYRLNSLNLPVKFMLLVIFAIVLVVTILGFYFDSFLKNSFLNANKQRITYGFNRLENNLESFEDKLREGVKFIRNNEGFIASIELINNYQNKKNYNKYLIDTEKALLAEELLNQVKLSFNNDIVLYDKNEELIAYVTKIKGEYFLGYVSYEKGQETLYGRFETAQNYHKGKARLDELITLKHQLQYTNEELKKGSLFTYHGNFNSITVKSHNRVFLNDTLESIASIEMTKVLDLAYFKNLSSQLNIDMSMDFSNKYKNIALTSNNHLAQTDLNITQTVNEYVAATWIDTLNGPVYIVASLQKQILNTLLNKNRSQLLVMLLFVALLIVILTRLLINRGISLPLEALMQQVKRIEQQDYQTDKIIKTGDELETISVNIDNLAKTLMERESALKKSQSELEYLSYHDPLTDLPNRRFFNYRLQHALNIAKRKKSQLAIFFLDLDQFKQINDTQGHNVGDELLVEVSARLKKHVRMIDTLARIGGDEFMILMEEANDLNEIELVTRKLLKLFNMPFILGGKEASTSVSIGIALYPKDGHDNISLTKSADMAMYKAKENGRNNYSFYSDDLSVQVKGRADKMELMNEAILNGNEFELVYQPKVSVNTEQVKSFEALIRWSNKTLGYVGPDQFIPLAEETGQIIEIGEWVMKQACEDYLMLSREGLVFDHVAINVSSVQLYKADFVTRVEQIIKSSGIKFENVELEITESYIATDAQVALDTLQQLRNMGLKLAIDDFGTGYSSMSYLKKMPVTRLKLDKSFVDDLPYSLENVAITKAIMSLAKSFGLQVTAEGVETGKQQAFLKKLQCDEIQGYYYAKPMCIQNFKAYCQGRMVG